MFFRRRRASAAFAISEGWIIDRRPEGADLVREAGKRACPGAGFGSPSGSVLCCAMHGPAAIVVEKGRT
jgi:hypothetical protein